MGKIVVFLYDRETRDWIANALRFRGYDVFAEESAVKSWERICSVQPELVITDYPAYVSQDESSTAATLVDAVRADPHLSHIPLISLTLDPSPDWLQRAERAGVTRSILRPFELESLLSLVSEYVKPRSLRTSLLRLG